MTEYATILTEQRGRVATITLNRPEALNALGDELATEVADAVRRYDADEGVGAIIITGSERAFAAGADITQMAAKTYRDLAVDGLFVAWDDVVAAKTPLIAAVAGFALGGGCELAMMCDIIIAADSAQFGQPEIKLGVIPGMGGTQRLTRAVGKAKAMELILTGRLMGADEAERSGLVARVVPAAELQQVAFDTASTIASYSLPAVFAAKRAVNAAFESTLSQGLAFEAGAFAPVFALDDQKEGMSAFLEKRAPRFTHG